VNTLGQSANFVETEQIIEQQHQSDMRNGWMCALVQVRGSIPILWTQRPNLRWMPMPTLTGERSQQVDVFTRHVNDLQLAYAPDPQIKLVDLINKRGRELVVGDELRAVVASAGVPNVRCAVYSSKLDLLCSYYSFEFHKQCPKMDFSNLSVLRAALRPDITKYG
jgi:hypothetical protein